VLIYRNLKKLWKNFLLRVKKNIQLRLILSLSSLSNSFKYWTKWFLRVFFKAYFYNFFSKTHKKKLWKKYQTCSEATKNIVESLFRLIIIIFDEIKYLKNSQNSRYDFSTSLSFCFWKLISPSFHIESKKHREYEKKHTQNIEVKNICSIINIKHTAEHTWK
jgi:hypothetical protein